jgi:hypothetical protein
MGELPRFVIPSASVGELLAALDAEGFQSVAIAKPEDAAPEEPTEVWDVVRGRKRMFRIALTASTEEPFMSTVEFIPLSTLRARQCLALFDAKIEECGGRQMMRD